MKRRTLKAEDIFNIEFIMRIVFILSALTAVFAVGLICFFLFARGLPAIFFEIGPIKFITGTEWYPRRVENPLFGILPMILGSIYVTAGAIIIGVPVGILTAVFMAKMCPLWLYRFLKPLISLLAGVPSVVYGFFGMMIIVPWLRDALNLTSGSTMLATSILLGIMILPTVITISESSLRAVPDELYEGAVALGASHTRAVYRVILPAAKSGVLAAVVLGIGRAIGETMAVRMVAGNQALMRAPWDITEGLRTMTTNIILEMGYADGLHLEALIATGVVLFVFIVLINVLFSVLTKKSEKESKFAGKFSFKIPADVIYGGIIGLVLGMAIIPNFSIAPNISSSADISISGAIVRGNEMMSPNISGTITDGKIESLNIDGVEIVTTRIEGLFINGSFVESSIELSGEGGRERSVMLIDGIDSGEIVNGEVRIISFYGKNIDVLIGIILGIFLGILLIKLITGFDGLIKVMTWIAAFITITAMGFVIGYILVRGVPSLSLDLFRFRYTADNTSMMPSVINTAIMVLATLLVAVPFGVGSAIYLVEYAKRGNKFVKVIRIVTETLAGIPSIVYGLFGMIFFVVFLDWGYSLIAGSFTLSIMVLPLIMRTTEESLKAVPDAYREGSFALGAGKLRTVFMIVLPAAIPGILAGIILSVGRIVGETAALMYTAGIAPQILRGPLSSARTLSVHMFILSGEGTHREQAHATAVILLILVIVINSISSFIAGKVAAKKSTK